MRQRFWVDPAFFTTATTSREVAVVVPETQVTHDAACMAYCKAVTRPEYFVPIEFQHGATVDEGVERAQHFVGQFEKLLTWWPEIWEAARARNETETMAASIP